MEKGQLRKEGESVDKNSVPAAKSDENAEIGNEVIKDSFGNEIKVEKSKTMTDKEKKQAIKKLQKQLKEGRKKNTLTDEQKYEIEDKIEALSK